ncbi:MAG: DoxX family membrane protein [Haloarculaceae archaeon]
MATKQSQANVLGTGVSFEFDAAWGAYWFAFIRVITGWWFFHAGITKIIESGFNYGYAPAFLKGMAGTSVGPFATWLAGQAWLLKPGVPLFETLIGLGLMLGALTRLAAFGGTFFMTLFWVGNAGFGHGLVTSNLLGLLLFLTMIVFATGRYYGLDAVIEKLDFVERHPRLRYLLG